MSGKSNIYTKTGDTGETSLVGGTRLSKGSDRIDLYGDVDELNAFIGYSRCLLDSSKYQDDIDLIVKIQSTLFDLGSNLACEEEKRSVFKLPQINEDLIREIEKRIDQCDSECPPLKNFILPGGHVAAASFHIARTVCRRVERKMIQQSQVLPELSLPFVNRLSDYFFVVSRYINFIEEEPEQLWVPTKDL